MNSENFINMTLDIEKKLLALTKYSSDILYPKNKYLLINDICLYRMLYIRIYISSDHKLSLK
mgnify:CR=1 FL=1